MFLTAYVDVSTWKFYFREVFLAAPLSQINRESFSEHVAETAVPEKPVVIFDTRGFGTWLWRAAFAFLAQASLTPSRWCQLSRRSVWAPFWRGARARAPGHRSWSVRARARTSAASCTSGSLGAISARRWSAGSKTANLALVVLRSSCDSSSDRPLSYGSSCIESPVEELVLNSKWREP